MSNIIMCDPKGGVDLLTKRISDTMESYTIPDSVSALCDYAFAGATQLKSVIFPQQIGLGAQAFFGAGLQTVHMHAVTAIANSVFSNCASLETLVCESGTLNAAFAFQNCSNLRVVDANMPSLGPAAFNGCKNLQTLILRKTDGLTTGGNAISASDYFKSGGAGGTIYIPTVLFDHLGDGSSLDYKAASGWSTIDGYGTITWAKIEGSAYETAYADGTPIPAGG